MSLAAIVLSEAVDVDFVTRAPDSYDADGFAVKGGEIVTPGRATVQPASGAALNDVPEGVRARVELLVWSTRQFALDEVVRYGGEDYRIVKVWARPADGYSKAATVRVADNE